MHVFYPEMEEIMKNKGQIALQKELRELEKQEKKLEASAVKSKDNRIKAEIESRIPVKVREGLESAFIKGFELVFEKGRGAIGKSINEEKLSQDHIVRNFALNVKQGRREWRQLHKASVRSGRVNLTVTTVEGIGLGALGIGIPDIFLFLSGLMRGIYEIAISYGFDYVSPSEQLLILKMMSASLAKGERRTELNNEVVSMLNGPIPEPQEEELSAQIRSTAAAFAMDMLILKFIQGLPVVGIFGGTANPVYYKKVTDYVRVKYRRRFLNKHISEANLDNLISK